MHRNSHSQYDIYDETNESEYDEDNDSEEERAHRRSRKNRHTPRKHRNSYYEDDLTIPFYIPQHPNYMDPHYVNSSYSYGYNNTYDHRYPTNLPHHDYFSSPTSYRHQRAPKQGFRTSGSNGITEEDNLENSKDAQNESGNRSSRLNGVNDKYPNNQNIATIKPIFKTSNKPKPLILKDQETQSDITSANFEALKNVLKPRVYSIRRAEKIDESNDGDKSKGDNKKHVVYIQKEDIEKVVDAFKGTKETTAKDSKEESNKTDTTSNEIATKVTTTDQKSVAVPNDAVVLANDPNKTESSNAGPFKMVGNQMVYPSQNQIVYQDPSQPNLIYFTSQKPQKNSPYVYPNLVPINQQQPITTMQPNFIPVNVIPFNTPNGVRNMVPITMRYPIQNTPRIAYFNQPLPRIPLTQPVAATNKIPVQPASINKIQTNDKSTTRSPNLQVTTPIVVSTTIPPEEVSVETNINKDKKPLKTIVHHYF